MTTTSKLAPCLQWFISGKHIDLCVDLSNQFGKLFPQEIEGNPVKQGDIRQLIAKGYIQRTPIEVFGVAYQRYQATAFATKNFEGKANDCSK